MSAVMDTCEVCERTAPADKHPCRFARGCTCWRGIPCDALTRAARRAAAAARKADPR